MAMMEEIRQAVDEVVKDKGLKALVFRAEGKHFSAGADVAEHTADKVEAMIQTFGLMFDSINKVSAVTIAAVDGSALGGGCELATFCDMVVASERAKFGQPEMQLGVFPPVAVIIFPYLVRRNKAIELLVSGKIIPADEALRIGLINQVFPAEEFKVKFDEFVAGFTNLSASSIVITKRILDRGLNLPVQEGLRLAEETYLKELMATADANEGLKAFLEKRKPEWKDK
jgi:cyclohexa-1,5-dienecarbonyl-CoA hydratase